jgi:DNA repair photolyase
MRELAASGVPVGVLLAPVVPALNDHEMERLLEAAHESGARSAGFMMLRLPRELAALFEQWLREQYPARADRVLNLMRAARGGRLNDPRFGHRMRGEGPYAELLASRFDVACRRLGFAPRRTGDLDASAFRRDPAAPDQQVLFT